MRETQSRCQLKREASLKELTHTNRQRTLKPRVSAVCG
jgi:hypothetical protein